MTPARRQKLIAAIDLIQSVTQADDWADRAVSTRNALIGMGARFTFGNTNTISLAGVQANCAWDAREHLLTRWAANARKALEEGDGEPDSGEEE